MDLVQDFIDSYERCKLDSAGCSHNTRLSVCNLTAHCSHHCRVCEALLHVTVTTVSCKILFVGQLSPFDVCPDQHIVVKVKLSPLVVHDLHSCEQIQWKVRRVNPHTHTHTRYVHKYKFHNHVPLSLPLLQYLCLPLGQLHTEEVKKQVEKFSKTMRTMQS